MTSIASPVVANVSPVRRASDSDSRRSSVDERESIRSGDLYSAHDFDINIDLAVPEPVHGM